MTVHAAFPAGRPRRLRTSAPLRRLVGGSGPSPSDLVQPLFVKEGATAAVEVPSMPGVVQHSRDSLRKAAVEAVEAGVGGLMLFAIPLVKDAEGTGAYADDGALNVAIRDVVAEVGTDTVVISDLCLDEFTDHGHCGVLAPDGSVDNDRTLERYREMGLAQASAGAHVLGLSGMMDGQTGAVRESLDSNGFSGTALLAYTAKYASAFYGPFRDAVESSLTGDRKTYQVDPTRPASDALRELAQDLAEGADIVMVKPALPYLDVLRVVADSAPGVPVAAYQVSGEMAMAEAAFARGWLDRERTILETLTSLSRAGAEVIATYWASEAARLLRDGRA